MALIRTGGHWRRNTTAFIVGPTLKCQIVPILNTLLTCYEHVGPEGKVVLEQRHDPLNGINIMGPYEH